MSRATVLLTITSESTSNITLPKECVERGLSLRQPIKHLSKNLLTSAVPLLFPRAFSSLHL
jgi:hypothetical protein